LLSLRIREFVRNLASLVQSTLLILELQDQIKEQNRTLHQKSCVLADRVSNSYEVLLLLWRSSLADDLRESAVEAVEEALVSNDVLNLRLDRVVRSAIHAATFIDKMQCALKIVTEQATILKRLQRSKLLLVRQRLLLARVQGEHSNLIASMLLRFVRDKEGAVHVARRRRRRERERERTRFRLADIAKLFVLVLLALRMIDSFVQIMI